jgi:predicted MPP superfamily phosphohydrolase
MRRRTKIIILLSLLAAGTLVCVFRWQAWFGMPDEPVWTGDTIAYSMPCPKTDLQSSISNLQSPNTFLVLGDIHSNLNRTDYDLLAQRVPDADAVLQTGDWLERGQEYYRQLLLREWTNSALKDLPVIACPGNHEYSKGLRKQLSTAWTETFYTDSVAGIPGVNYYIDFPAMRLIVLDTNPLDHIVWLTRSLTWLRRAMNSADGRFIVVLMHHPVLSVAKGRFNPAIYATFRHALGQADLVLCGHDHSYMRKAPFVVLNTAGKSKEQYCLYTPELTDTVPVYGILKSEIRNQKSEMQLTIHRLDDGMAIDTLYVTHD